MKLDGYEATENVSQGNPHSKSITELEYWQADDRKLNTGPMLAIFTGESSLRSMAVTINGTIVVGEGSGRVHFLRIQE